MSRHYKHFWVFALIYNYLLHQLSLGSPVFVRHFLSEGTGRNIRHLPCVSRRTGETGVCMFAFTCAKANGTHLGTCIDRFYFGSCCKLEDEADHVFPQDNTIDVDNPPSASKPFVTSSTVAESNDVPGNVDRLKTTTASTTHLTEAPKTTAQTTLTTKANAQTTRKPPSSFHPTTESIRLSTFQSVQNASEQRPLTLPNLTTVATTRPSTAAPSSTPAFGQRITSKKPPFSSTYNSTKAPLTTGTSPTKLHTVEMTRPRPSTSSSSTTSFTSPTATTRRNVTSSLTSPSNAAKKNLTSILTTTPFTVPTTIPTTILATRFPPRNATTVAPSKASPTTSRPSSAATETKPSSTRKPSTTKKPVKSTTKRPNSPTKRPSLTPTTKRTPTTATTTGSASTKIPTTSSSTKRPSSPVASSSRKPPVPVTTKPTTTTSSTTFKPGAPTTSASTTSKRPTGTTLRRPVATTQVPSRRPVTTTTTAATTTKVSATSARPTTTSSAKPPSTRPVSSSAATEKPVKVSAPSLAATGTSTTPSTPPSTTESTRKPSTEPVSSTEPSRKPSTQSTSTLASTIVASTAGQKNATSQTTISNELDAEFASEAEHATTAATTVTHGIVTWTSFSDETESFTKPPETSTVATDATETLEWTPITTPDGWIIIQSPTSSEKPEAEQQKPGTTSSSQTMPPTSSSTPSLVTAKPPTESSTRQTTTTSTSTTTTHRPTTQPSTYVDALSTFATVSVSPDFSLTEPPTMPLNMTNFKDVCGRRLFPESRIVGGDGSTFGKWPWQISLRQWRTSTYLHKCGAALLNENWAITAAHCVQNVLPSDLLLRIGEHDLGNEEEPYGFQERRVQIVASHPNFDPRTFEFDLALMRFYEPVLPFQPNVLPICIPDNDEDYVGQTAFVTGWGRLYEDGPLPSVLQEVAVPVINNSVCEGMYRNAGYIEHIPHIFICAGWRKGGFDSCEGDSGGPLVIQRKRDKRWVLAGVISWGIGCAEPNQPGVYTRISEFREWINQILQF